MTRRELLYAYRKYGTAYDNRVHSPAECTGARKEWIEGNPDIKHVSTSFAERQNRTMRMHMRRFTRLTNGSGSSRQRRCPALHVLQLCPPSCFMRMTPAMAAGVTGKLWEISDIVALIEAKEAEKPAARGRTERKVSQLIDPQPITNENILRVLCIVLVEIRATDDLSRARMLADSFHNAPAMIASGAGPQDTWASVLGTARRLDMERYVVSLLSHVQARQISN